jgi:RNAse (barnase) inhibitor barstar
VNVKRKTAAALADLPAYGVQSLAWSVEQLRRWTQEAGHRFVLVDLAGCDSSREVLVQFGHAFAFPEWYGANLDALYDCLTDLIESGVDGVVVVIDHLPQGAQFGARQRTALLDVFRDALEPFADAGVPLRVYYA